VSITLFLLQLNPSSPLNLLDYKINTCKHISPIWLCWSSNTKIQTKWVKDLFSLQRIHLRETRPLWICCVGTRLRRCWRQDIHGRTQGDDERVRGCVFESRWSTRIDKLFWSMNIDTNFMTSIFDIHNVILQTATTIYITDVFYWVPFMISGPRLPRPIYHRGVVTWSVVTGSLNWVSSFWCFDLT
jgi:hypothetical protein